MVRGMRDFLDNLPPEFEPEIYRSLYGDLAHMDDTALFNHYRKHGSVEGRRANRLKDRQDFAATIPIETKALEIGPFTRPMLAGANVAYFDVLPSDALVERARQHNLDPQNVPPHIDYVSPTGDLSIIDRIFDVVVGSNCLEHQPDPIRHLQGVARLLQPGGAYYMVVPDHRYCFDHFIPPSNIAEMLAAYSGGREVHTWRSVIEHAAMTTHNDFTRHWQGDHGVQFSNFGARYAAALKQFTDSQGRYIDVHAWYFTPDTLAVIIDLLRETGLIDFHLARLYRGRYGFAEFWAVLRKPPT
jgi:SAM-dependent methyltransferase